MRESNTQFKPANFQDFIEEFLVNNGLIGTKIIHPTKGDFNTGGFLLDFCKSIYYTDDKTLFEVLDEERSTNSSRLNYLLKGNKEKFDIVEIKHIDFKALESNINKLGKTTIEEIKNILIRKNINF